MPVRKLLGEFRSVLLAIPVVERRQDDRRAELALVDEIHGLLVVRVHTGGEALLVSLLCPMS